MSVEAKKLIDFTRLSRFKELMDQSVDGKLSRLKIDLVQIVSVLPELDAAEEGVLYLIPTKNDGEYGLYAKETVDGVAKFAKNSSLFISGDLAGFLLKADAEKKYISAASVADDTITLSRPDGSTVVITVNNVAHATKADQDGTGAVITATYATKAELTAHATAAESTYVQTGAVDQTVGGTKTFSKPIAGSVTGNAATATKLAAKRTINGTAFDGTANVTTASWGTARDITIADSTGDNTGEAVSVNGSAAVTLKLPATIKANVTGNCSGSSGSCTGNAATATKLATARTINGTAFDGTANITTANWGTARNITITDGTNISTAVSVNGSANVSLTLPATIKATFVGNVTGNCSGTAGAVAWNNVSGKPSTFAPSSHNHDSVYVKLSGGTITNNINKVGISCSWKDGRTNAIVKTNATSSPSNNQYVPCISAKSYQGSWELGTFTNNDYYLTYITDANFDAGTNTATTQYKFCSNGTLIATKFQGALVGNVTGNVTGNCSGSSGSCTGNAATASKVVVTVANNNTEALVQGTMGSNDYFRIAIGGASNAGWAEIATGDDYNEPIYVRQYQGSFATLKRTATLLDASGNTSFPGTVTATGFSGPLTGNVTGNCSGSSGSCTGNAASATQFSANATVALTGDATGTSAGSKKGWSVPVTLANSGVTAGTYGPSANVTGNNNATISVPEITVDAKGRVTSVVNRTLTCKNNTYNVYNKTLTIQKNGTKVATFTSNSNTDVTANITVPTKTSELTNNSGFLTSHQSLSNYVTLNGAQTISGAKTFTGNIIGINKDGSTENANSLYSATAGSKLIYYTTSNGSTKLTNVPAAVNTTLESRTIRRLSDSDWIVEQICHNSNGLYYRKGSNGTWGAWKTFAFTDSNISGNAATATRANSAAKADTATYAQRSTNNAGFYISNYYVTID